MGRQAWQAASDDGVACAIIGQCVLAGADVPLPGLRVKHLAYPHSQPGACTEQVVTTDGDGRFRVIVREPRKKIHEILLGSERYSQRRAWFEALEEGQELLLGTVEMRPGIEVRGSVLDDMGLPVANVHLLASVPGVGLPIGGRQVPFLTASTTVDGSFSFGPLPAGDHDFSIAGTHLEILRGRRVTVDASMAGPVNATIIVRRLPVLSVTVLDPQGRPVTGAVVRVSATGLSRLGPFLNTDEHGRAVFDAMLPSGTVEVWSWARGFAAGKSLAPAMGVRGFVTSMTAQPIGGTLRPVGQREGARWIGKPVVVAADGVFDATLPPGDYRWVLERGRDSTGSLLVGNVVVHAGAEAMARLFEPASEEVELAFAPELLQSLQGRVWIRYQAAPELRAGECVMDATGSFMRVKVIPGERFLVEAPPHRMVWPERDADSAGGHRVRYLVRSP